MNTLQFQLKGEVGTGRNCYTLLMETNGVTSSYRIRANNRNEAVKIVENALNCKLDTVEVIPRKKWQLKFKYGAKNPAICSEIYLTKTVNI